MAEQFIQLPPDSTGKKLRTFEWLIGLNTVNGESQVICDPADGTAITITTVAGLRRLGTEAAQGPAALITAPWPVILSDGAAALGTLANPLRIDPTGTTAQPVSGTVTANIGTTGGLALEATLSSIDAALDVNLSTRLAEATFTARINTLGQKVMAASTPVVIASDQSPVAVSGTVAVTGTVTANQGTGAAAAAPWSVRLSDGAAFYVGTQTGQLPAVLVGGRLDTNLGAWLGSTAPTVGQKTMAASVPVVIASDQTAIPTLETRSSTTSVTSVASSATNVTLLASNANRLGATIYNDSVRNLFVKLGATASATSFSVFLPPDAYYEVPFNYTGIIDGIWNIADGSARITELT